MSMSMLTLQETKVVTDARKIVEEMADDMGDEFGGGDDIGAMPPPSGGDMPMEPPVSDSAIGASTEDNVALGLLREIRDLLATLAADEAGEGGEAPELPPEDEGGEPSEGEERAGEDEEEQFKPGKRPMPVPSGAGGE